MAAFQAMMPVLVIILLVALAAGLWMVIDAWGNYGAGWGCLAGIGCLFFSWIAILLYLIIRFAAFPPSRIRESYATGPPGASYRPGTPPPAIDLDLAPEERDSSLDELIAEGRLRDAMERAQDLLKMAKDFRDQRGIQRYAKYVERIRRGMR